MDNSSIIGRWASLLLAEILNISATVAEKILRGQPRWLAQLRLLEANLREPSRTPASGSQDDTKGESGDLDAHSTRQVLESYAILSRTLKNIEARGLALDDALVERMISDWNPRSIVGYLLSCDTQLKQEIGEALNVAAVTISAPALPVVDRDEPKQKGRTASKGTRRKPAAAPPPKSRSKRRKDMVS